MKTKISMLALSICAVFSACTMGDRSKEGGGLPSVEPETRSKPSSRQAERNGAKGPNQTILQWMKAHNYGHYGSLTQEAVAALEAQIDLGVAALKRDKANPGYASKNEFQRLILEELDAQFAAEYDALRRERYLTLDPLQALQIHQELGEQLTPILFVLMAPVRSGTRFVSTVFCIQLEENPWLCNVQARERQAFGRQE